MRFSFGTLVVFCVALLPNGAMAQAQPHDAGAVFVMTNAADKNEIVAYGRAADGTLEQDHTYSTGGRGSGGTTDPLGSQASLLLSQDQSLLFAANAGSGDVSVFRVNGSHLNLMQRIASGGAFPNAIAQSGKLVYVLNAGGTSGISGFRLESSGHLTPIPNSTRFLSTGITAGSSIVFSPNGAALVVIERLTNNIDVFVVQTDGTLVAKAPQASTVAGAFAALFAPNGTLLVVATGPSSPVNSSAISSYAISSNGTLSVISNDVPTMGAATCWHAITPNGQFLYTSNSATSSISGFTIGSTGVLNAVAGTIVENDAAGSINLDIAISADGKFLYALNAGVGTVGIFAIQSNGALNTVGSVPIGVMQGLNGIAAF